MDNNIYMYIYIYIYGFYCLILNTSLEKKPKVYVCVQFHTVALVYVCQYVCVCVCACMYACVCVYVCARACVCACAVE